MKEFRIINVKRKVLYIAIASFTALQGCYYDVAEDLYPAQFSECDTVAPTYAARIAPMMAANCATSGCHSANAQSPNLSTYEGLSANITRVKQRAVIEKTMPTAGPMNPCDVQALQQWIDAGAINN
jgi:hypothetical protein